MKDITKKYSNGEVTIVWKPIRCIHCMVCCDPTEGTPSVFKPGERPWVRPEGATTERIVKQVSKCPSGALSYYFNIEKGETKI